MKPKHIKAYIKQCEALSECSDCPRGKYGCVIVEPITNTVRSQGYNNASRGIEGLCGGHECIRDKLGIKSGQSCELGCNHAESNAVCLAARNGISIDKCIAFVSGEPCLMCSKMLFHAGINHLIVIKGKYSGDGIEYLKKVGVKIEYYLEEQLVDDYFKLNELVEVADKIMDKLRKDLYNKPVSRFVKVGSGITELEADYE